MKLISEKYRQLLPTSEYLNDEVVMAQAWKKTHSYIRTHNWYADTLALDVSALSLERTVRTWAEDSISDEKLLEPLELIPAAKSDHWIIDAEHGWTHIKPNDTPTNESRQKKPPLRPLAHLTVRDQTWATAVMMCMADAVETAQGDCNDNDFLRAQHNKVYSYGNRLVCDWNNEGKAWFRWGNSSIYRKFFTDYQNFLKRPVSIGKYVAQNHNSAENVYVINLDLSKFYDNIDRTTLLKRLKEFTPADQKHTDTSVFWKSVKKITNWKWSDKSSSRSEDLNLSVSSNNGLPQGLVSAGFFANAYLNNFDQAIGRQIEEDFLSSSKCLIPEASWLVLHDYCRYVDDLRLVISIDKRERYDEIENVVNKWVNGQLAKHAGRGITINEKKTAIISLSDLDNKGSLSSRIALIQNELSGPADRDLLDTSMSALEGLLSYEDDDIPSIPSISPDSALHKITKFNHDVRPDTLKRFAANRLETLMRNKRKIDYKDTTSGNSEVDNLSELLAKKLIKAWLKDPSLALVLRKALEIFPSTELAEPVFDSVLARCSFTNANIDKTSAAMMDYVIADLFRCFIDFHTSFQRIDAPATSNPKDLMELVCRYAQKVISTKMAPLFVERQALLLLAINQKQVQIPTEDLCLHHHLHALLAGQQPPWKHQLLALYEIAAQITGNPDTLATQCLEATEQLTEAQQRVVLDELAKRGGGFWLSIWRRLPKAKLHPKAVASISWASPSNGGTSRHNSQLLDRLIATQQNPFLHEAALISLALALIEYAKLPSNSIPLAPSQLIIKKKGRSTWQHIYKPTHQELTCSKAPSAMVLEDPRFTTPTWIAEDEECEAVYWIGTIMRAATVGASDFTANRWKPSKTVGYKGLRTGWYKRRIGMMHTPEVLVGEFATLSSWASELIMKCLQWPGFESTYLENSDIAAIQDLETLKGTLISRLTSLNKFYCHSTDMPALITKSTRPKHRHEKGFRLVSVQQLLPRLSAFTPSDIKLDSPAIRSELRDHLARLCQLTYKTLQAKLHAENKQEYPGADIIVFPELAIHADDQDLIKRLADKTQAIIFAGMCFQEHEGKIINVARWFIPNYKESGRQWIIRDQGKAHPMKGERNLGVQGHRPCQHIIEVDGGSEGPFYITGAVCYDATDLKLASDLKDKSDLFIIAAHNKDVRTFDAMASALNYHMYQHVVVVNKGEFGGSTIQAPYKEVFDRLVSHSHGSEQVSINIADLDLAAFRRKAKKHKPVKTPPANSKALLASE